MNMPPKRSDKSLRVTDAAALAYQQKMRDLATELRDNLLRQVPDAYRSYIEAVVKELTAVHPDVGRLCDIDYILDSVPDPTGDQALRPAPETEEEGRGRGKKKRARADVEGEGPDEADELMKVVTRAKPLPQSVAKDVREFFEMLSKAHSYTADACAIAASLADQVNADQYVTILQAAGTCSVTVTLPPWVAEGMTPSATDAAAASTSRDTGTTATTAAEQKKREAEATLLPDGKKYYKVPEVDANTKVTAAVIFYYLSARFSVSVHKKVAAETFGLSETYFGPRVNGQRYSGGGEMKRKAEEEAKAAADPPTGGSKAGGRGGKPKRSKQSGTSDIVDVTAEEAEEEEEAAEEEEVEENLGPDAVVGEGEQADRLRRLLSQGKKKRDKKKSKKEKSKDAPPKKKPRKDRDDDDNGAPPSGIRPRTKTTPRTVFV